MRILVAAENYALGSILLKLLCSSGHEVDWLYNLEDAFDYINRTEPDLVVLDLSDGIGIQQGLDILRFRPSRTSVFILNDDYKFEERIQCLELGAEDCVAKPFRFKELAARCEAILRRKTSQDAHILQFGIMQLDRIRRHVTLNENTIKLTTKEFLMLDLLVQANGRCVPHKTFLSQVWQEPPVKSNLVQFYMCRLRQKLSAGSRTSDDAALLIENVHAQGYRLRWNRPRSEPSVISIPPIVNSHQQAASVL